MQKEHRWLKTAIATSAAAPVTMPWHRENRSRPAAMKPETPAPTAPARKISVAAR